MRITHSHKNHKKVVMYIHTSSGGIICKRHSPMARGARDVDKKQKLKIRCNKNKSAASG
ncbi:hypothetical protein AG1IA_06939 [Rhizoctonia solani AG-1 IA]|uniref:Uncharacterized protein n=1 Tax=Thanatephorus cucumeris (strain AG1-IA) TaxID=983506 RepID=L8WQH3_THACA|nr:hypothetical protein AG1IA_06939 [Rhizoctonia solani AG-1 IA]